MTNTTQYLGDSKISSAERDRLLAQPAQVMTVSDLVELALAAELLGENVEAYPWQANQA